MDLYERVKQQQEIENAGIEGLEACPFCEWKCVIEVSNVEEKLFRCGNEDGGCGAVSCRMCKKEVRIFFFKLTSGVRAKDSFRSGSPPKELSRYDSSLSLSYCY